MENTEVLDSVTDTVVVDINTDELLTSSQNIENLLIEQNQILESFHVSFLYTVALLIPFFILFLLYKFIKLFY